MSPHGPGKGNMNLNGQTLKLCFLMIVSTLCLIVLFLVGGVIFCHFPIEESKMMIGLLGVSSLFGGICQAFIHANITDVSNKQAIVAPVVPTAPIVAPTAAIVDESAKRG